ncbi:MAG: hypothetical protein U9Q71_08630 [Pseudomonadota bacterium]|nr:hypothetical protein [Pseudomonadota bacterium]
MFVKSRALLFLFTILSATRVMAGTVVEFSIVGEGIDERQTAFIQDGLIYVENAGGLRDTDLLFDAGKSSVVMINHDERNYYTLDESEIDSLTQLAASVATTMENQREVLSDILGTFGLGGILEEAKPESETPADKRLENTGQQMTVSGLRCHLYRIWRRGRLDTELCIAGQDEFPIPANDYDTLEGLYQFGDKVFGLIGELLTRLGVPIPMLGSDQLNGLPVFINSHKEGLRTFVDRIQETEVDASRFRIPRGYESTIFPLG